MYRISLTMSESSRFGWTLYNFWYCNRDLVEMAPNRQGYPNNGGQHSFTISSEDKAELVSFLELYGDAYPRVKDEIVCIIKHFTDPELKDREHFSLKDALTIYNHKLLWRYHPVLKSFTDPETEISYTETELRTANFKERRELLLREQREDNEGFDSNPSIPTEVCARGTVETDGSIRVTSYDICATKP